MFRLVITIQRLHYILQGFGLDADFGGVVNVRNTPFVGAEAFYRMSEETVGLMPFEVAVPRNSDGRFSGDAFLTYETEDQAIAAEAKLRGHVFQGRSLEASVVRRAFPAYTPFADSYPRTRYFADDARSHVCGNGWLLDGTFRLGTQVHRSSLQHSISCLA